jgi:GNAT superfamily N-acetyltransferase
VDTFEVRELGPDDLTALLGVYRHLHREDDPLPAQVDVDRIWADICANPDLIYVAAFRGDELVASCTAVIVPNLTRGARPYAVIENVVTAPDQRRSGLATAVLQDTIERCRARDCYKIMLASAVQREEAHGLYERNGFDRNAKQAFLLDLRKSPPGTGRKP